MKWINSENLNLGDSQDGNPKSELIGVEKVGSQIWFKSNDAIWSYDLADLNSDGQRRKSAKTATPDQIVAQMPGKITKIFIQLDQDVVAGQPLLVMEAMKMEYTLKSEMSTKVEKIAVNVGDQISVGTLLVKLKV